MPTGRTLYSCLLLRVTPRAFLARIFGQLPAFFATTTWLALEARTGLLPEATGGNYLRGRCFPRPMHLATLLLGRNAAE